MALTLASAFFLISRTAADPDLWGHVLFGLDLLRTGTLPQTDSYSYVTGNHPWINHEILSEVLFGFAYRTAGTPGLLTLKMAVTMSMVLLLYRHLLRRGLDPLRAGIILILIIFAMLTSLGTMRPHLFTFLFFLLTLLAIECADRGKTSWLWTLPLVFAAWINFHGGVLAGLGILFVWAGARVVRDLPKRAPAGARRERVLLLGVVLASLLSLVVNPYAWRLPLFLVRTATVPRPDISEWHPLGITTVPGILYVMIVAIAGFILIQRRTRLSFPMLAVLAATAVLPLMAYRHLALFALTFGVVMAGPLARSLPDKRGKRAEQDPGKRIVRAGMVAASMLASLVFLASSAPSFVCIPIRPGPSIGFPAQAVGLLSQSGASGNLAIHFDYGEYAIWHLKDRFKVSMDGRRETVYPDSIYEEALRFQGGRDSWDDVLERHPTDLALVPVGGPTYNLLALKPGWQLVHRDGLVGLFARESGQAAERLRRPVSPTVPADGAGMCFP
ncbi:MAG: hypothetical protein JSV95_04820 [Gemmatimonadota bacterium]|nr:MAG: hypothetical protein JSV95_04820 [Gemmatimonadota bacterium]